MSPSKAGSEDEQGVNGIHLGQLPLLTLHHSCPGGLLPELGSVEPGSPQLTGK